MTLPFYTMSMNQFRAAAFSFVSFLYVGSFVMSMAHPETLDLDLFSASWSFVGSAVAAGVALLPKLR